MLFRKRLAVWTMGFGIGICGCSSPGASIACATPLTASASVSGTFLGKTLTARDALAWQVNEGGLFATDIAVVDYPGACAHSLNALKATSNVLDIHFNSSNPPQPGTFTAPGMVDLQYAFYDQTCHTPFGESANSGTVTLTRADACGFAGTFDVVMASDHVTGSFVAPICNNSTRSDGGLCF